MNRNNGSSTSLSELPESIARSSQSPIVKVALYTDQPAVRGRLQSMATVSMNANYVEEALLVLGPLEDTLTVREYEAQKYCLKELAIGPTPTSTIVSLINLTKLEFAVLQRVNWDDAHHMVGLAVTSMPSLDDLTITIHFDGSDLRRYPSTKTPDVDRSKVVSRIILFYVNLKSGPDYKCLKPEDAKLNYEQFATFLHRFVGAFRHVETFRLIRSRIMIDCLRAASDPMNLLQKKLLTMPKLRILYIDLSDMTSNRWCIPLSLQTIKKVQELHLWGITRLMPRASAIDHVPGKLEPLGMMTYLRQFEGLQQIVLHLDRTGDNTQDLEVAVSSNHFVEQLNSHYKWVPLWIELAGNLPDLEPITLEFPKITKLPKGGVSLGVGGGIVGFEV